MNEIFDPPKKSSKDTKVMVTRAAVAAIPYVGGAALEIFSSYLTPPIEQRRQKWVERVASELEGIRTELNITIEDMSDDPEFISALVSATRAAIETHEEIKIECLVQSVKNSAVREVPEYTKQSIFTRYISELSVQHLLVLKTICSDEYSQKIENPENTMDYENILMQHHPEMDGEVNLLLQILKDLGSRGLIEEDEIPRTQAPERVSFGVEFCNYFGLME